MLNPVVGKYYVNKTRQIARKVLSIDGMAVKFRTYHLDSGNSCDAASECTKREFIIWADHETKDTELAGLQAQELEQLIYAPQARRMEDIEARSTSMPV